MQTKKLPSSICAEVEKISCSFVWGDLEDMKWCNKAYMMKLAWGIIEQPEALWVKVLKNKYNCGPLRIPNVRRKRGFQLMARHL